MKKTFKSFFVFAAAALTLAGCQRVEMDQPQHEGEYRYSFTLADDTRAVIGDSNVEWVAGDQVGMFVGNYKGYAKVDVSTTPKMVVLYSNEAIPAGTMAYAYAPYDAENKNNEPDWTKIAVNGIQSGAQASAMPLAGVPFEVEEEIDPKAQEGNGQIKFMNLGSVINFKIFSTDEAFQNETIKSVQFESTGTIAGVGYIDLTAVDMNDESTLELLMDTEENTVKVNEEVAVAAEKEEATPIKMVVLPGKYEGILTVTTDVATYMKEIPEREFARSHSRTFGLDLAKAERSEVEEVVKTLPYEEPFTSNQGDFEIKNVTLPEGQATLWAFDASFGAKVTAYIGGTNYAAETMLVSPWIDLTEVSDAAVTFDHTGRYFGTIANEATFWALSDEEGADWVQLTIPKYFGGTSWTWVNSDEILLSDFVGKKVKVAFKYTSTKDQAGTWEIKNFSAHIVKADPELSYEETAFEADVYDDFTAPTLVNPHGLEVYYYSSNEDVAMVDENTGEVVLMGTEGIVTITAAFDGDDNYKAGSATYTITVSDSTVEAETFFYESFDEFYECTGGNDGQWTGSIANYALSAVTFDESGWTYKSANAAYCCAKVGTGSADGYMTTRTIAFTGNAKLTFKAAGWGTGTNTLTVTATGATLSGDTEMTVANAAWTDYHVTITGAEGEVVLTFTGHRFFLDEVAVFTGSAPVKPEEKQEAGLAYGDGTLSFIVEPEGDFTAPELTNPHNLTVTYSSSDEDVALVDEKTGEVLIGEKEGTATITASFAGSATYLAGSASYKIIVRGEDSPIVDVLDRAFTGVSSGNSYADWSGKIGASGAVYAGNSAGGNEAIQLRSSGNNSGIVTTTSGGKVKKFVLVWQGNTAKARTVYFYGSNTAYTSPSELYDESTQGTLLGSLTYDPDAREPYELVVEGDYNYIGLRSYSGALYLTEIDITWE